MAEPRARETASDGRPPRAGGPAVPLLLALLGFGVADGLARLGWLAWRQWQEPVLAGDSWTFVNREGPGWPVWLLQQHNEHRIVLARLATVVETELFRVPPASTALLQSFLLTLASIGLLFLISRSLLPGRRLATLTGLSGSLLLLNPWQWENFSWEFQTPWIFCNTLVLLATWILGRRRPAKGRRAVATPVVIALLPWAAIFSIGQGMALSLSLCIASLPLGRRFWLPCFGSTLLALGAYVRLVPFAMPATHPQIQFNGAYFGTVLLGGPWPGLRLLVVAFLALLLALGRSRGAILRQGILARPELLLPALFSLLFALMTTLSRSGIGPGQANASRYVTHSLMLAISLLLIATVLIERRWHAAGSGPFPGWPQLAPGLVVIAAVLLPPPWAAPGSRYRDNWNRASSTYEANNLAFRCQARAAAAGRDRPAEPGDTPALYFSGALEVRPAGWHERLVTPRGLEQLRLKGAGPGLRYGLTSASAVADGYALRGWALDPANLCDRLTIVATYAGGRRWAGFVQELQPAIQQRFGIVTPLVGFDLQVPASLDGRPLASLTLEGERGQVDLLPLLRARLGQESP